MTSQSRELIWLRRTRDLSQMIGSEEDPAKLPPLILSAALELTEAERAFLVRVEGPGPSGGYRLKVLASRGFRGDALEGPAGAVSRTVVERTLAGGGRAVITSRPEDAQLIDATSVIGRGVRSMVSVPMRSRGQLTGVLYLDHRGETELFRETDLPTLQTFATQAALSLELARVSAEAAVPPTSDLLIGESDVMSALRAEAYRVGQTSDPVLICGEPGTESLLVAREIHAAGGGDPRTFRTIDCAAPTRAVAADLLGSEGEPGLLSRLGSGSTICLESVESLDPHLQRVLSRALRQGEYVVAGTSQTAPIEAQLVALTAANLAERLQQGQFLADLYYRLDVQRLVVPPLRQRREDLPALCQALIARVGGQLTFEPSALERMSHYAWPGNLLELEGEVRRLASRGLPRIRPEHLREEIRQGRGITHERHAFSGRTLSELEEEMIRTTLAECGGVKARAARQLGIPRSTLYHLLERYGLE